MAKAADAAAAGVAVDAEEGGHLEAGPEPWFTGPPGGPIRFTDEGVAALRAHFGRAGIDIRTIASEAQFHAAWQRAAPWLGESLLAIARNGTMTVERQLLVAVMQGDAARAADLRSRLERRRRIGLRSV